jgi:hypothetical protein
MTPLHEQEGEALTPLHEQEGEALTPLHEQEGEGLKPLHEQEGEGLKPLQYGDGLSTHQNRFEVPHRPEYEGQYHRDNETEAAEAVF